MENLLLKTLSELSPNIRTPFCILDEKMDILFGNNIEGNISRLPFSLYFSKYFLETNLHKDQALDFCFFIKNTVYKIVNHKLINFSQGKNVDFELSSYPVGLILIKSNYPIDVENFICSVFDDGYIFNYENITATILPIDNIDELKETSIALYQNIAEEISQKTLVSLGGIANNQGELVKAYNNATKALKFSHKNTGFLFYHEMALQRLFSYVSKENLLAFRSEMNIDLEELDSDIINTIRVVLDCNLRLSEAARKLYIHRNTLIYRLDKIKSLTGLDLRIFKDAVKMEIYLALNEYF